MTTSSFQYERSDIEKRLKEAVEVLKIEEDRRGKFESKTGQTEWNLAGHLATILHGLFPLFDCDIDITKQNYECKRPDIIIHKRGNHTENLLVIEVKFNGKESELKSDKEKIQGDWFREPLKYQFGSVVDLRTPFKGSAIDVFENKPNK